MSKIASLTIASLSALGALLLGMSGSVAETIYKTPIGLPGSMNYDLHFFCDNTGSTVSLTGNMTINKTLPAAYIELWNSPPGSQQTSLQQSFKVALQDLNGGILYDTTPKQPSLGGVGGNPYFWFKLDSESTAQFLGRCISPNPASAVMRNFNQGEILSLALTGSNCSGSNSTINITAGKNDNSVTGSVYQTNNYSGTLQTQDVKAKLAIIFDGGGAKAPKSVGAGGAGGNPIVKVQFLQCMGFDSDKDGILSDTELASCVGAKNTSFSAANPSAGSKLTDMTSGVRCNKL